MRRITKENITEAVLESLSDTPDPRLRRIFLSLVRHLHAFARDVELTEAELYAGLQFLTATGQKCDDKRQEFILLSDVLGLSMLTVTMNNDKPEGCTESTVFGPFYVDGAPRCEDGEDIARGAAGQPCEVTVSVRALDGAPVAAATVDVWQADAEGRYDVQRPELDHAQGRGQFRTDAEGRLRFRTVLAQAYPIPVDGPVGTLLEAANRHPWRPAHLHFMIQASGYDTLITHVFKDGDPYLDSDAVFGVRPSLVAPWTPRPDGRHALHYDFVLARVSQDTGAARLVDRGPPMAVPPRLTERTST